MAKPTNPMDVEGARVAIRLNNEDLQLIPSPAAVLWLSERWNGITNLFEAVRGQNARAMVDVVLAGCQQMTVQNEVSKARANAVIAEGVERIRPQLLNFVNILTWGGRLPNADEMTGAEGGSSEDDAGKNGD